jgi:DNA-binding NarL/FixJ family response regulator
MEHRTPSNNGRVLVVDDDEHFRTLATSVLERAGFETDEVDSGADAIQAVRASRPTLVLLDVNVPDGNGYEVCHVLRTEFGEEVPIIFVSGERKEGYDQAAGLMIGADDYIVKPFDADDLVARVRRHAARSENGKPRTNGGLSRRELEVMRLLAGGMTQDQIAESLFISPKTVATHVQRILGKLGVRTRTQAVALALRQGIVEA